MTHIFTTIKIEHWSTFFFLFGNVRHYAYIYNVVKSAVDTDLLSFLVPKKG